MKKLKKYWKNRKIIYLDVDEIAEPLQFIEYFFESSSLPEHLYALRKWRDEVSLDRIEHKKRSPADILYDYELTIKLVEAAWLLKKCKIGNLKIRKNGSDAPELYLKKERDEMEYFPFSLNLLESLKLSSVLKNIFRTFKLSDYQRILYIWLSDAMSTQFFEENLTKQEVIMVYENIVKMFEATWLINEQNRIKKQAKSLKD